LQIAKAWWEKKHAAINESNSLQEGVNRLKVEVEALRNAKDFLWTKNSNLIALNKTITSERDFLLGERDRLKADLDVLKSEIKTLKSTNQILLGDSESLSTALEHNLGVNQDFAPLSKSLESFGGLKKVTDASSRVAVCWSCNFGNYVCIVASNKAYYAIKNHFIPSSGKIHLELKQQKPF
jgi:hypothetical protein